MDGYILYLITLSKVLCLVDYPHPSVAMPFVSRK